MNEPGIIFPLCAAFFWSIAVIIFRTLSIKISPLLITGLKNIIALIFFIILFFIIDISFINSNISQADFIKICLSGILGMGIGDILFIYALSKIGANRVAILNCFEPSIILLFSFILLPVYMYQLNQTQIAGFIIVIIGVLIMTYEKDKNDIDPKIKQHGIILQVCAIILSSIGIIMIKPILELYKNDISNLLWITSLRLFSGTIIAWIFIFIFNRKSRILYDLSNKEVITKIIISSFLGTFIALSLWIIGYGNAKTTVASILGQMSTIFIFLLSVFILNEKVTYRRLFSILFTIFGACLTIL